MKWQLTKVFDTQQDTPFTHDMSLPPEMPAVGPPVVVRFPHKFRLFDDDGHLYYEGYSETCDDEAAFAPLDWAGPDSGCTRIDYQQPDGTWEML